MSQIVVALEGSPLAGKTTLSARILRAMPDVLYFPDYVEMLQWRNIPPFDPGTGEAQLAATSRFLDAESARVAIANRNGYDRVLLDRSIDTLLSHAYALDQLRHYGCFESIAELIDASGYLRPDCTILLEGRRDLLLARWKVRDNDDSCLPFISGNYLEAVSEYFSSNLVRARSVIRLESIAVSDIIPDEIMEVLSDRA